MATTIGTSTNLIVVSIAADQGVTQLKMFDFALPVLIVGSIGLAYLWLVAPRLLPERKAPLSDTAPRVFSALFYVNADSAICGKSFCRVFWPLPITRCVLIGSIEVKICRFTRLPSVTIREGDRLAVRDMPERLKRFEKQIGATLHSEHGAEQDDEEPQHLAEIVVTRDSMLYRASLLGSRFAQRTGLLPLALHRGLWLRPRGKSPAILAQLPYTLGISYWCREPVPS